MLIKYQILDIDVENSNILVKYINKYGPLENGQTVEDVTVKKTVKTGNYFEDGTPEFTSVDVTPDNPNRDITTTLQLPVKDDQSLYTKAELHNYIMFNYPDEDAKREAGVLTNDPITEYFDTLGKEQVGREEDIVDPDEPLPVEVVPLNNTLFEEEWTRFLHNGTNQEMVDGAALLNSYQPIHTKDVSEIMERFPTVNVSIVHNPDNVPVALYIYRFQIGANFTANSFYQTCLSYGVPILNASGDNNPVVLRDFMEGLGMSIIIDNSTENYYFGATPYSLDLVYNNKVRKLYRARENAVKFDTTVVNTHEYRVSEVDLVIKMIDTGASNNWIDVSNRIRSVDLTQLKDAMLNDIQGFNFKYAQDVQAINAIYDDSGLTDQEKIDQIIAY